MVTERDYCAALTLWNYHTIKQPLEPPYDILLGLGSYDLRVAHHVADLYHRKVSNRIVLSGGAGNWTKGMFNKPEAMVFNDIVSGRGVPAEAVRLECAASNLGENISFTRAMFESEPVQRVLLITKPHTKRRAYATALKQWPNVHVTVSSPPTSFDEQPSAAHTMDDLINEIVGDTARLRIYPALGYQVAQDLPDDVALAFRLLCQSGYTTHLPVR